MTTPTALGAPHPCPACGADVITAKRLIDGQTRTYDRATGHGGQEAISGGRASYTRDPEAGHRVHDCTGTVREALGGHGRLPHGRGVAESVRCGQTLATDVEDGVKQEDTKPNNSAAPSAPTPGAAGPQLANPRGGRR